MQPQKVNMFYLLELLTECSDEDHVLTTNEILELLRERYGVKLERRSVYSYVNTLMFLGIDIAAYEGSGKGYYLRSGYFTEEEIRMLIHGIYLAPECGRGDMRVLTDKLQRFLSGYKRRSYRGLTESKQSSGVSKEIYARLFDAVCEGSCISFLYPEYTLKDGHIKKNMTRHECGVDNINAENGAAAICGGRRFFTEFMEDVSVTDKPYRRAEDAENAEDIIVKCSEELLGAVIEEFGARVLTSRNGKFTAVIAESAERFMPWAMANMSRCEVIEPVSLRDAIIGEIKGSAYARFCGE